MSTALAQLLDEAAAVGLKVRVHHTRFCSDAFGADSDLERPKGYIKEVLSSRPDPKGGTTVVALEGVDGKTTYGTAKCSRRDNFNRKTGTLIALGRALKRVRAGTAMWIRVYTEEGDRSFDGLYGKLIAQEYQLAAAEDREPDLFIYDGLR